MKIKPTYVVLALLCVMYFITYVDRVNISTAAGALQKDLGLTNIQYGLAFSVFGYPYLLFQVAGGWLGDRFGARRTLALCGLIWAVATILTGLVGGLTGLLLARLLLGFGEGATFPTATRAMQYWTPPGLRGLAQGLTHAFSRIGNTVTPPLVAALMAAVTWRGAYFALGCVSLVWVAAWAWYFRDEPKDHPGITTDELARLPARIPGAALPRVPWRRLIRRMAPVTLTYFCYGWCLWLYLSWLPLFFQKNYNLEINKTALYTAAVFVAGVLGDTLGGVLSDLILHRTGNVRLARLSITVLGFTGSLLSLLPILVMRDMTGVTLCLAGGFFFAEMVIGPMWSIPMDIAPKFSGAAAGLMNMGSALAAIVSPLVAGYVIDATSNWYLPFLMTIALLLLGALSAFLMHPEKPLDLHDEPLTMPPNRKMAA